MEQLSDLNKRIRSVQDIAQMTKAMQLISAVKMKRARDQLASAFPFFALCAETLNRLKSQSAYVDSPFLHKRKKNPGQEWKMAFFVFSGDQGMAGSYIVNLLSFAEKSMQQQVIRRTQDGYKVTPSVYLLGSMGKERFRQEGLPLVEEFHHEISNPNYNKAMDLADIVRQLYLSEEADEVFLIFTRMHSALSMTPLSARVLPAGDQLEDIFLNQKDIYQFSPLPKDRAFSKMEFIPDAEAVFRYLIHTYLNGMMYGALTEAFASEQTARMTAMDSASKNASDMIRSLSIKSNQARQAKITAELSEIVGGAAVLTEEE